MRKPGTSWENIVSRQLKEISRVTISLWKACEVGRTPIDFACKSFGIDSQDHVNAIKWCIDNKKIFPKDLESAKCSGSKMNSIILLNQNPYNGKIIFETLKEHLDKSKRNK